MIRTKRSFIAMLICTVMIVTSIAALPVVTFAAEPVATGTISDTSISWSVYDADGDGLYELEFSGTGAIPDYTSTTYKTTPWLVAVTSETMTEPWKKVETISFVGEGTAITIGQRVFSNYTGLATINFNGNVEGIETGAFYKCSNTAGISFDLTGVKTLKDKAFQESVGVKGTVVVPASIENYVNNPFAQTRVEKIVFEDGFSATLADNAFNQCVNLKYVIFSKDTKVASTAKNLYQGAQYQNSRYPVWFIAPENSDIGTFLKNTINDTNYPTGYEDTHSGNNGYYMSGDTAKCENSIYANIRSPKPKYYLTTGNEPIIDFAAWTEGSGMTGTDSLWVLTQSNALDSATPDYTIHVGCMIKADRTTGTASIASGHWEASSIKWGKERAANVTKAVIDDGVTSVGNYMFANAVGGSEKLNYARLKSVKLSDTVTVINSAAFQNGNDKVKTVETVNFPPRLQKLSGSAFAGTNISGKIELPATLTYIGKGVFQNSTGITEIEVLDGGQTLEIVGGAFNHMKGLSTFKLPAKVAEITLDATNGRAVYNGIIQDKTINTYYGDAGPNVQKNNSNWNAPEKPVTFVVKRGTLADTNITANVTNQNIYIPTLWTTNAPRVMRILPDATEYGATSTYYWSVGGTNNDTLLISGTLAADANFKTADKKPWKAYNSGIKTIIIDEGIENVPAHMFEAVEGEDAYSSVDTIELPLTLLTIGEKAFSGIASDATDTLTVTLPSGLTAIGKDAFAGSKMANTVTVPATVESDAVDTANMTVANTAFSDSNVMRVTGNLGTGNHVVVAKVTNNTTSTEVCRYVVSTADSGDLDFDVKFKSDAAGGLYTLTLEDKRGVFYTNAEIAFVNRTTFDSLMATLNTDIFTNGHTASNVDTFLTDNKLDLGLIYDPADNATSLTVATYVYDMIKNEALLTGVTPASFNAAYRNAVIMTLAKEGELTDISAFAADIAKINEAPLKAWYDYRTDVASTKTDAWRAAVSSRLNSVTFANYSDFEAKLKVAYVFAMLADPASNALTKSAVEMAASEINDAEYTLSDYLNDNVAIKLTNAKPNYTGFDYTQLKADIKSYFEENSYTDNGNNNNNNNNTTVTVPTISGGGGVGGGGAVKPKPIEDDKVEEAPVDEPVKEETNITGFADMADFEWAQPAVKALRDKGIVSGDENGNFNPDNFVTREEFVKMIANLLELPEAEGKAFADVSEDDWFKTFVDRAYANGIISGISETEFGAGRNISRQDMCVILFNAIKHKGLEYNEAELEFGDMAEISDYAEAAVKVLSGLKVINGYEDNTFKPMGNATRAEAAKVIYMIMGLK